MKSVRKLAFGFLRQHPVRLLLTVSATVAATCLVVWMVSGYEAILRSYDVFAERALGRYTLSVDPISRKWDRQVQPEVVDALRDDPDVEAAEPMWADRVVIQSQAVRLQAPAPRLRFATGGRSKRVSVARNRRAGAAIRTGAWALDCG